MGHQEGDLKQKCVDLSIDAYGLKNVLDPTGVILDVANGIPQNMEVVPRPKTTVRGNPISSTMEWSLPCHFDWVACLVLFQTEPTQMTWRSRKTKAPTCRLTGYREHWVLRDNRRCTNPPGDKRKLRPLECLWGHMQTHLDGPTGRWYPLHD